MEITGAVLERMEMPAPYGKSRPISVCQLELDEPQEDELLVRITASGICHSDLSVVNGVRPRQTPMLLGHESTGIIEKIGPGVTGFHVGQHVTLAFLPRCGECKNCKTNGKLPCIPGSKANNEGTLMNGGIRLHRDGEIVYHHIGVSGFATYAVVDRRSVVPVPDEVPADVAAVLGCAVLTGGGAVLNAGNPQDGEDVMVVGLGGVGMSAVLTAAGLGKGRVIGVDRTTSKFGRALDMGATEVYTIDEALAKGIKAPIVIEAAGAPGALDNAFNLTDVGGKTVTVGFPKPTVKAAFTTATITGEARTIMGSYLGSAVPTVDIPKYAQMWLDGKLPVEKLISHHIRLDDINEAMDELDQGRALRQVIEF